MGEQNIVSNLKGNIVYVKDKPATYVAHSFEDYGVPTIENMSLLAQKAIAILMQPDEKFPERSRRAAMHCGEGCGRSGLMTAVLIALEKVLCADESSLQSLIELHSYREKISNDDNRDRTHMDSDQYCQLAIDIKKSFTNTAEHPYVEYPNDMEPEEYIETGGQLEALSDWVKYLVDIRTEHGIQELIARFNTSKNIDEFPFSEDSPCRSAALHYDEAVATNISYPYIERIEAKLQNSGLEAVSASELLMATPEGMSILNKALAIESINKTELVKKVSPFLLDKYLKFPDLSSYLLSQRLDISTKQTVANAIIDEIPRDYSQYTLLIRMLNYDNSIIDDTNAIKLIHKYSPDELKGISYEDFLSLVSSLENRGEELIRETFDKIGEEKLLKHAITYVKQFNNRDNLVMYQLIDSLLETGNEKLLAGLCQNTNYLLNINYAGQETLFMNALNQIAIAPNFDNNKAAIGEFLVKNKDLLKFLVKKDDACPAKQVFVNANIDVLCSAYKERFLTMDYSQFKKLISEKQYQLAAALMDNKVRPKLPEDISNIDKMNIKIFRARNVAEITKELKTMSNKDKKQWFKESGYNTLMQRVANMDHDEKAELERGLLPKIALAVGGKTFVRQMLTREKPPIDAGKKSKKLSIGSDNDRRNSSTA